MLPNFAVSMETECSVILQFEATHLMPQSSPRDLQPSTEPAFSRGHIRRGWAGLTNALAFSNGLPAAIAVAISLAASESLSTSNAVHSALIAGCGTFVVYALDRLRDTARDQSTSPLRTEFTLRNQRRLIWTVAVAGGVLLGALWVAPLRVVLLCAATGGIGILHRRLKEFAALKTVYVSLAWVATCVGIPWANATQPTHEAIPLWTAAILFATIAGNLIASNHRDGEARVLRTRPGWTLRLARACTVSGLILAVFAPEALRPLVWIPIAEAAALTFYRPTELYGQLAVDGALLFGALASLLHFAAQ